MSLHLLILFCYLLHNKFVSNLRNVILANGEIYHVFNRGVERRVIFSTRREYQRALETINFYRFSDLRMRYSHFMNLNEKRKREFFSALSSVDVVILAYCLMPNHFHLLLQQEKENGISKFVANFTNSYSKFFNIKHDRVGPLHQGPFKAVRIETREQLLHVSRYIHLNPVTSFLINEESLDNYEWSSLPEYLNLNDRVISNSEIILSNFKNKEDYRQFVHDQIDYGKRLEMIKHLTHDEV